MDDTRAARVADEETYTYWLAYVDHSFHCLDKPVRICGKTPEDAAEVFLNMLYRDEALGWEAAVILTHEDSGGRYKVWCQRPNPKWGAVDSYDLNRYR